MLAAAAGLPRPPLFGVATIRHADTEIDFEIGWEEFGRDTAWAESVLTTAGLRAGDIVLVNGPNSEGPWISPVVNALRRIGVTYLCSEIFGFDARRTSMFLQRLPVRAIIGLSGETVVALGEQEPPIGELMRNVETIWARLDAVPHLSGVAPAVVPFVRLGPALALGIPGRNGAFANAAEWAIEQGAGQLLVSNAGDRATVFDRVPTGVAGSVRGVADGLITLDIR